jgi:hypothetical protein
MKKPPVARLEAFYFPAQQRDQPQTINAVAEPQCTRRAAIMRKSLIPEAAVTDPPNPSLRGRAAAVAIHLLLLRGKEKMDCFAPLAMTRGGFHESNPMASGIIYMTIQLVG